MMKRFYPIFFTLLIGLSFSSCIEPALEVFFAFGTIENAGGKNVYDIRIDNGRLLSPTNSTEYDYIPENGQRVVIEYNILEEKSGENSSDPIRIKLVYLREILTKDIFYITPETEDSIGNDDIVINSMWIGNNYLNIGFTFYYYNQTHLFNLVLDEEKTYDDGEDKKIHLEFRHNAHKDLFMEQVSAYASYSLESLQDTETDSVNLVIHALLPDVGEKTYELTYKYKTEELESSSVPRFFQRYETLIPMEDIK